MESLQRKFGIQDLILKFLGQFIPGFYKLYHEGHKYAIFFARLLQLFHPEPVQYSLALYLVKIRMEFHPLIDKYDRFIHDQGQKKELKESETFGRNAYEAAGTGGLALVSDVIDLIYNLFAGDRESGTKALELIKPENISEEEFLIFRICHKMTKLGNKPEDIFNAIDSDGGGTISADELITGLKSTLELWISESAIRKLLVFLNSTGEISKKNFLSVINMKTFIEWNKNPAWRISKALFLITIIEVYKHNQRKLAAHLNPHFLSFKKAALDKEEFEELILTYEPSVNVYDIEKLYSEALTIDTSVDGVSFKSASAIICKYGFGNLKSFKIKELLQELSLRKNTVDLGLTIPGQALIHKKVSSHTPYIENEENKRQAKVFVKSGEETKKSKNANILPSGEPDDSKSSKTKIGKRTIKK